MSLFEWRWSRWHDRATKRAMKDPEYARIENIRIDNSGPASVPWIDEDLGLGWAESDLQNEIFWRVNRRPLFWHVHHWLDDNGVKAHRNSRKARKQRGKRGFADSDVWNLYHYLADTIANSVEQLSKTCHGYPGNLTEDEWTDILNKIELGFRLAADDEWMYPPGPQIQDNERTIKEAFDLLHDWWFALWD